MITAIIIDDESHGIKSLSILLNRFAPEVTIQSTALGAKDGILAIETHKPQLVFLDISMPEMDGFELLNQLHFRNFYLIFTTAHREYGLKAIKQNAMDYLLKPIDTEDLLNAIKKVKLAIEQTKQLPDIRSILKQLSNNNWPKVPTPTREGIENISSENIAYLEAQSNHCSIYLKNNTVVHSIKMLKDFETTLCKPNLPFYRIHNSYIINLNCVNKYIKEDGGHVVLNSDKKIPVSKHKKEEFLNLLNLNI